MSSYNENWFTCGWRWVKGKINKKEEKNIWKDLFNMKEKSKTEN